jgi:tetratricopeptide (TPR) repeat protein
MGHHRNFLLGRPVQQIVGPGVNVADTLGWVYYQKGMTTAAVRELEAAAKVNAKDPIVHYHLGKAYNKAGYIEKAKASLELALKLDPNFADAADARQTLGIIGG